ncbi:hypothetical protein AAC387_Pa03g2507 [Persea americana]
MGIVVPRNTSIPTKRTVTCTTAEDSQTFATVSVYQGERDKATDNHLLGQFTLSGIPASPKRRIPIIVCFEIDANGTLTVSAEVKMGKKNQITINSSTLNLSNKEIKMMLQNADKYKLQDQEYRKKVEAQNALEDRAYNIKNANKAAMICVKPSTVMKKMIEWTLKEKKAFAYKKVGLNDDP